MQDAREDFCDDNDCHSVYEQPHHFYPEYAVHPFNSLVSPDVLIPIFIGKKVRQWYERGLCSGLCPAQRGFAPLLGCRPLVCSLLAPQVAKVKCQES